MLRAMRSYASSSRDDRHLERPVELDQKQGGQQQPRHSKREGSELQGLRRAPVDPPVRRKSVDTRLKEQVSMQHFAAVKASVVAPGRDAPRALPGVPLPPVGERAAKAAAFVFRACDGTRSGTLLRWEFASAVEMMMRQKLVPYLIEQLDAARLDAEFAEAAQGADECGPETFARWFEKFDAYLLNFYPEPTPERPPRPHSVARNGHSSGGVEGGSSRAGASVRRRMSNMVRRTSSIAGATGGSGGAVLGGGAMEMGATGTRKGSTLSGARQVKLLDPLEA